MLMAEVDKLLVNSYAGNYSKEVVEQLNLNLTYRVFEIFQVRTFCWLIEQACNSCNDSDLPITMVELGADTGHYSRIFHELTNYFGKECLNVCTTILERQVHELIKYLPRETTRVYHGYSGQFTGSEIDVDNTRQYSIEDLITENSLNRIDFLHVDIQGGEVDVIREIKDKNLFDKIRYYFISTHNDVIPNAHLFVERILGEHARILVNETRHDNGWAHGDGFILAEDSRMGQTNIPEEYRNFAIQFNDAPAIVAFVENMATSIDKAASSDIIARIQQRVGDRS